MATLKNFEVSLNPAQRTDYGSIQVTFSFTTPSPRKRFTATTLDEAKAIVTAFAAEYGKGCSAYVKCLDARKPAGFDKVFREMYFNL